MKMIISFLFLTIILVLLVNTASALSTILQTPNTENLEDTYIREFEPDTNYDSSDDITVGDEGRGGINTQVLAYIKFSLESLPQNITVTDVKLGLYLDESYLDTGMSVYAWEFNNQSWLETYPTWNNFVNNSNISIRKIVGNVTTPTAGEYFYFNATRWVNSSYLNETTNNVSFFVNTTMDLLDNEADYINFHSKDYSFSSPQRPYLNITYIDLILPSSSNFGNNISITDSKKGSPIKVDVTALDNVGLNYYVFAHNLSGTLENQTFKKAYGLSYFINETITINISRGNVIGYQFWFNDTFGNSNQTNVSVFDVANTIPLVTNVSITELPLGIGDTGVGHFNITDADYDTAIMNQTKWYINGTENVAGFNNTILNSDNVTNNANIIFSARVWDGYNWSIWVNSSQITTGDTTAPNITNISLVGLNLTISCIDEASNIGKINFTINHSGTIIHRESGVDFSIDTGLSIKVYYDLKNEEILTNGTYNITHVGCIDTNTNQKENLTTNDNNFSISPPKLTHSSLTSSSIYTDQTTILTMVCQSDPKLKIQTINFTINISDSSLLVRNNPTFFTFTQNYFVNASYEIFKTSETANVGEYNITQIGCYDTETNYIENVSTLDLIFTVSTRPSPPQPVSGGGGGGTVIIINETENVTIIIEKICNENGICEADKGEDFINCKSDCKFEINALNPLCFFNPQNQQCIYRRATVLSLITLVGILALVYLSFIPQNEFDKLKGKIKRTFKQKV